MPRASILTLFATSLIFVCSGDLSAQNTSSNIDSGNAGKSRERRTQSGSRNVQVAAELKRQRKFLGDVASRYEAVSVHDLTPLLSYSYVWNALRENRTKLTGPNPGLTSAQLKQIEQGYDLLETEVLLQFLDHQLSVLNDTLELEESQFDAVERALSLDLNQKRALLSAVGIDSKEFLRRLRGISDQTEAKIISILYPEQRKTFYKQLTFNRDRLIG